MQQERATHRIRKPAALRKPLALFLLIVLTGCGSSGKRPVEEPSKGPGLTQQEKGGAADEREESKNAERKPAGQLTATYHPRKGFALRLEQHEGKDAYSASVRLERKQESGWKSITAPTLSLRRDCSIPKPSQGTTTACRSVTHGGALVPPAHVWPVKIGAAKTAQAECPCRACMTLQPGQYRAIATSCAGTQRVESETFWVE